MKLWKKWWTPAQEEGGRKEDSLVSERIKGLPDPSYLSVIQADALKALSVQRESGALDLSRLGLAERDPSLPQSLCILLPSMTHLTSIDLSYNRLQRLPAEFEHLSCLRSLSLTGNHLGTDGAFPLKPLRNLDSLEDLNVSFNFLSDLEFLPNGLRQLTATHNRALKELPFNFYGFKSKLQVLNLSHCDLESLEVDGVSTITQSQVEDHHNAPEGSPWFCVKGFVFQVTLGQVSAEDEGLKSLEDTQKLVQADIGLFLFAQTEVQSSIKFVGALENEKTCSHDGSCNLGCLKGLVTLEIEGNRRLEGISESLESLECLEKLSLFHQPIPQFALFCLLNTWRPMVSSGLSFHKSWRV